MLDRFISKAHDTIGDEKFNYILDKAKNYEKIIGNELGKKFKMKNEIDVIHPLIMRDMMIAKSVIVIDTYTVESINFIYHDEAYFYTVPNQKYLDQHGYFTVKKDDKFSGLILFM